MFNRRLVTIERRLDGEFDRLTSDRLRTDLDLKQRRDAIYPECRQTALGKLVLPPWRWVDEDVVDATKAVA